MPETGSEAPSRQDLQRIEVFIDELLCSPLAVVTLESEPAVIDFIVDRLLEDPVLAGAAHCAAILSFCGFCGGRRAEKLELVASNLASIFSGQMPRRNNSTLLHAAAAEGNERLLTTVLHVLLTMHQKESADDGAKITPSEAKRGSVQSAWHLAWQKNVRVAAAAAATKQKKGRSQKDATSGEGTAALLVVRDDDGRTASDLAYGECKGILGECTPPVL